MVQHPAPFEHHYWLRATCVPFNTMVCGGSFDWACFCHARLDCGLSLCRAQRDTGVALVIWTAHNLEKSESPSNETAMNRPDGICTHTTPTSGLLQPPKLFRRHLHEKRALGRELKWNECSITCMTDGSNNLLCAKKGFCSLWRRTRNFPRLSLCRL